MTDRLWTRPATLTPDERECARLAYEQAPTLLDDAVMAAFAHIDAGDEAAALMLETIRRAR
jgi:hypothetical protein